MKLLKLLEEKKVKLNKRVKKPDKKKKFALK